jgi:hypothetical protein
LTGPICFSVTSGVFTFKLELFAVSIATALLVALSDAPVQQGYSDELTWGRWLLKQTLADAALTEAHQTEESN